MRDKPADPLARGLMDDFAQGTGLTSARIAPRRYLWTDAFAVCNFIGLYRRTGDPLYKEMALTLVDQVHTILGRHRPDDARSGWISGLDEAQGATHPTRGGLRIGKKENERGPGEPCDDGLEWDRDGQYFHYLTKWMHALHLTGITFEDETFLRWAVELAKAAHAAFTGVPPHDGRKRMAWKMSIDLTYALVPSMGHHDPLDGLITYLQLQAAGRFFRSAEGMGLTSEIAEMRDMCRDRSWTTDDPLGIGGLLSEALRLARLGDMDPPLAETLLPLILEDALSGLRVYERTSDLDIPADYRMAFRELGLSIGLHAVVHLARELKHKGFPGSRDARVRSSVVALIRYTSMSQAIECFWSRPASRASGAWKSHRDINGVMLSTALDPEAYLSI